jgi:hypothetical protein
MVRRRLCPSMLRVYGFLLAMHNIVVDAVFDIGGWSVDAVQTLAIRLVVGEEELRRALTQELALPVVVMLELDDLSVLEGLACHQLWAPRLIAPSPGITKP